MARRVRNSALPGFVVRCVRVKHIGMSLTARLASLSAFLILAACTASTAATTPPRDATDSAEASAKLASGSGGASPGGPGAGSTYGTPQLIDFADSEDSPCQGCTVDASGMVRGTFKGNVRTCGDGGADLYYPLREPVIEVLAGAQARMSFPVAVEGEIHGDQAFEAALSKAAQPADWRVAIIWLNDNSGRPCASRLYIVP